MTEIKNYPRLFIYLNSKDHVNAWVDGGGIPLYLASKYKRDDFRGGIYTPDENIIKSLVGMDYEHLDRLIKAEGKSKVDMQIGTFVINDKVVGRNIHYQREWQDGLILCCALEGSKQLMDRFEGKEACVEIIEPEKLFKSIDDALGTKGVYKKVEYTENQDRNHFLKSTEDDWQKEFRGFWPIAEEQWIEIPKGIGRELAL